MTLEHVVSVGPHKKSAWRSGRYQSLVVDRWCLSRALIKTRGVPARCSTPQWNSMQWLLLYLLLYPLYFMA